jgi:hypothetical protein
VECLGVLVCGWLTMVSHPQTTSEVDELEKGALRVDTYPFADLDQSDLEEVRKLESRLTQKQRREVILIAYCTEQERRDGSLESYYSDPTAYGALATAQESGLRT